jgi:DNA invertase Pin-like site-specific DNA recombinase
MICAIYARISKENCNLCGLAKSKHPIKGKCKRYEGQDEENQLLELRRYAKAQGWETVEYIDRDTGKHADRDGFQQLFADASRRKFQVVLVWALDRLTREGVLETFAHVKRLTGYGVQFESYTEPFFRTTGPAGELLMAVLAWVAKQERIRISERTKAGLARARAKGRIGGRPAKVFDRVKALELRKQGTSWRAIGKALGVAQSSIRDALKTKPKKLARKA